MLHWPSRTGAGDGGNDDSPRSRSRRAPRATEPRPSRRNRTHAALHRQIKANAKGIEPCIILDTRKLVLKHMTKVSESLKLGRVYEKPVTEL